MKFRVLREKIAKRMTNIQIVIIVKKIFTQIVENYDIVSGAHAVARSVLFEYCETKKKYKKNKSNYLGI